MKSAIEPPYRSRRILYLTCMASSLLIVDADAATGQFIPTVAGPMEDVWTTDREVSWLEGPSYGSGSIWFGDPGNIFGEEPQPTRLMQFDTASGTTTTAIGYDAGPNIFGTEFDSQDRLIATHLGQGLVTRRNVDQLDQFEILANGFAGPKPFIPNDLVVDANDGIYFTSFMQNAPEEFGDSAVFYINPEGDVSTAIDLAGNRDANGIGISPDGSTLYVAFAFQGEVRAYDIAAPGMVQNERPFSLSPGGVDGLTVDRHGNVYVSDLALSVPPNPQPDLPGSTVRIFNPAGEELLSIDPPHGAINMTFAPDDSLYITGWNNLTRVPIAFEPQTHKIVSPSSYADVEGEGADTTNGTRTRAQQVFPAEDFSSLEDGTYAITQIAWRPDGTLEPANESVYGDVTIQLALTDASYDETNPDHNRPGTPVPSTTFAENFKSDPVTVHEGQLVVTTENQLSANGVTKEFDQVIEFERPYLYDPSDGNLLLDMRVDEGNGFATMADFSGEGPDNARIPPNWQVVARDPDHAVADAMFRGFITEFTLHHIEPGDFDANGILDVADLDLLVQEYARTNPVFDLNEDGGIDEMDYAYWAKNIRKTWIGDANLDGVFDSGDLVDVFRAGKYERDEPADWSEGDWNGDGRFNSSDLTAAFRDGGYEAGQKTAIADVPEPTNQALLALVFVGIGLIRRRHGCVRVSSRSI